MENNNLPYQNPALPIEERLSDLLGRMTLEEKLAQLNAVWLSEVWEDNGISEAKARQKIGGGIGQITRPAGSGASTPEQSARAAVAVQEFLIQHTRLGIPAIIHEECCSGLMARHATVFPQIIGLACSWDAELVEAAADVIRSQMRAIGAHQGLAPILDINRDARWGRVEETFGEDPTLTATLGTAYVRGLQGAAHGGLRQGVAATGKHFAAHGFPEGGLNWAPVRVGERELREVYLLPFEAAVREAGLAGIMNAYHELDGIPCAASHWLLTEILRDEWGFEGIVVSDYNAIVMLADYHRVAADKREAACLALTAGLDLELPGIDCYGEPLHSAVHEGMLDQATLDMAVRRILKLKFRLGLFDDPPVNPEEAPNAYRKPEQTALARRAAQESMVLLKNEDHLLPLKKNIGSLAVIGPNADALRNMVGDYSYASFMELIGGMEQPGQPPRFPERLPADMLSILEAIRQKISAQTVVRYARGCGITDPSKAGFDEALAAAQECDAVVLVMGGKSGLTEDCTCGELRDRATLGLLGVQEDLVWAILATGKPTVLVLVDGRPAAIPELVEKIPAVLEAWLPGEQGGQAVADVLFGEVNPGGKLAVSIPRSAGHAPVYYSRKPSGGRSYNFWDYVDASSKALFPFGHGLSYTQFEYRELHITPEQVVPTGTVEISFTLQNVGDRSGDEVAQLYIQDVLASVTRPVMELKGFRRIPLQAGEARRVTFALPAAQLAFYDRLMQYVIEPGKIRVCIGSSSEDIRLEGSFEITGEVTPVKQKVFFSACTVR